jgi:uncharacterized protein (TIGR02600 family)
VPSAIALGSLPVPGEGWRTLCFAPNSAASVLNASSRHPGQNNPPDHLLLDLFNMPVVEPYAISEPFSTGGRVNMNYQIAPFGWIKRSTAMRAALQSSRVTAVPSGGNEAQRYKTGTGGLPVPGVNYRKLVSRDETIKSMDMKFDQYSPSSPEKGFFKSASQICEQFLYPVGVTAGVNTANIKAYWNAQKLTGDNMRERPYADLYPRVTTKSNTYTVHMRVQTLRKRPFSGGKPDDFYSTWEEGKDQMLSEYRGSAVIERYLNPQDRRFDKGDPETVKMKDYIDVDSTTGPSLEQAYKFRVINVKRFLP